MKIFVINLIRSKDRRKLIESNLGRLGLPFELFAGIDARRGEHLGISRFNAAAPLRDFHRPLSAGEIGCFASHYLLWQRCIQDREPFVIMEDDVVVDDGFVRAIETVPELIGTFPLIRLGLTWEAADTAPILSLRHDSELVSLGSGTFGTQCYVLTDVAAKALVEHAAVWSLPVDIYFDRPQIHGVGSYGLRPYFVRHADQTAYPSVIGDDRYGPWPQSGCVPMDDELATAGHLRKTKGLEIEVVGNQCVVSDAGADRLHYLNPTAALIWEFCDGNRLPAEIAALVQEAYGLPGAPLDAVSGCLSSLEEIGIVS